MPSSADAPGVYLYEHINFQGRVRRFTTSQPFLSLFNFNKIVSSWRIVGDYSATVFTGVAFTGRRSTLGFLNDFGIPGSALECSDMRQTPLPFGVAPRPGCYGEVRNDEASSIGIGASRGNMFASPLYWPKGTWALNAGTQGGISVWAFSPDGKYELSIVTPNTRSLLRGRWANIEPDPFLIKPRALALYNTFEHASGAPVKVSDTSYPYRVYENNVRILELKIYSKWTSYAFRPA